MLCCAGHGEHEQGMTRMQQTHGMLPSPATLPCLPGNATMPHIAAGHRQKVTPRATVKQLLLVCLTVAVAQVLLVLGQVRRPKVHES